MARQRQNDQADDQAGNERSEVLAALQGFLAQLQGVLEETNQRQAELGEVLGECRKICLITQEQNNAVRVMLEEAQLRVRGDAAIPSQARPDSTSAPGRPTALSHEPWKSLFASQQQGRTEQQENTPCQESPFDVDTMHVATSSPQPNGEREDSSPTGNTPTSTGGTNGPEQTANVPDQYGR